MADRTNQPAGGALTPAADVLQLRALVEALGGYPPDAAVKIAVTGGAVYALVDHRDLDRSRTITVDDMGDVTTGRGPVRITR